MTSFKKSSLLLLLSAAFFALVSCTKTPDNPNNNTTNNNNTNTNHNSYYYDHSNLNSLFRDIFPTQQTYTLYAGTARQFITPSGTIINIFTNTFKDKDNNVIINDSVPVILKISDAYTPGSVIASRSSTNYMGNMFSIQGQVFTYATIDGQQVFLGQYGVGFDATNAGITNVDGFGGSRDNIDSLVSFSLLNMNKDAINYVDSQGLSHNVFMFDDARWPTIACGKTIDKGQVQTNIFVTVPDDSYNSSNTTAFLVFPDKRSVMFLTDYNSDTHTFELNPYCLVPLNQNMEVVVISNKDGLQYGEVKNLTSTINLSVSVNMGGKSAGDITTALSQL